MGQGKIDYTRAQISDLLDRLDAARTPSPSAPTEFSYRQPKCAVIIREPAGSREIREQLPARSLSSEAVRLMIGRFVNLEATCVVTLITRFGSWIEVKGTVRECTYVENGIHEIVVSLDAPVDPGEFCEDGSGPRVLVVEDNALVAEHAGHVLSELNALVEVVGCGEDALVAAVDFKPDGIILDIKLPDIDGYEVVRRLGEIRYRGSIVAYTALGVDEASCRDAGFQTKLSKPVQVDEVRQWLSSLRDEPILSDLHGDRQMQALISTFVEQLPGQVAALRERLKSSQPEELVRLARDLCIAAKAHGFPDVSKAAALVMERQGAGGDAVTNALEELERLAARVRCTTGAAASA